MTNDTSATHLMQHFTANHFSFVCQPLEHIQLDAQPGTAIRGALYHALINTFSPKAPIAGVPLDPVRMLLANEDETNMRGRDVPRAFAVQPPLPNSYYPTEKQFRFGVSLYGSADALMPYLFRAVPEMGKLGIGKGRGRFTLERIHETNPLNDTNRIIMHQQRVQEPRLTITHARILEEANLRSQSEVTVRFLTPMRLIEAGQLVRTPKLGTLLRRLIERSQALVEQYCPPTEQPLPTSAEWRDEWARIGALGDSIDANGMLLDATRWVDINSYSSTRKRSTPIGGFIGQARWRIESLEILVWLLWGQSLHTGKNSAKGDGYFHVE